MRLKEDQVSTFRVSGKRNKGQLGMWIAPSRAERKFRYDIKVYCR
jgi:hypothetical protein